MVTSSHETPQRTLPRHGKRTYLGCAYLYIEAALAELTPTGRRELAKDLRAYIDLLTKGEPTFVEAPSITPAASDAVTPKARREVM